jgi:hypothetical protein
MTTIRRLDCTEWDKGMPIERCFALLQARLTLAITWPQGEHNGEGSHAVAAQVNGDVMLYAVST